jgi:Tfp pilus assembly protein PilE
MDKTLVNIMIVCLIFSVLSIVMTSGNDDIAKAKAEAEAAAAEAEAAVAKAKAAAEAAVAVEAAAEAEELDTSFLSFSTSAALSFDDDFIAPDISAGKARVNCVIGPWTNVGGCNKNTGVQIQKRLITPAKYGGTCAVSADDIDPNGYQEQDVDCDVNCEGGDWSESTCTATCGGGTLTRTWANPTYTARNGGTPCPPTEYNVPCNTQACPSPAASSTSSPPSTYACKPKDSGSYLANACEHLTTQASCESTDDNYGIWANYSGVSPNYTCHWVDTSPPAASPPPPASCKGKFSPSEDDGISTACPNFDETQCTSSNEMAYGKAYNYYCEWS